MEKTALGIADMASKEGEMALRISSSFKKQSLNEYRDKLKRLEEKTREESKCEEKKKKKMKIERRRQSALFLLKLLVSQDCHLEGWKAFYAGGENWRRSESRSEKSKSAVSKWARMGRMAAKVGKGLSKDEKGQKLALRHWLEVIDTHHRYGHNLHFYYNVWVRSQSSQPFFHWLDTGDGKDVNLNICPRSELQKQCIRYLKPEERKGYEVIIRKGKLIYRKSKAPVHTPEGSKWIFVLSTSRTLYIGEKKKGIFHHSSFLAGGATIASGRLVASNGLLDAIWPYSGHYCPTEKQFQEFITFLEQHKVDLTNVKKFAVDDDVPPSKPIVEEELDQFDCREDNIKVCKREETIVEISSQVKEKKPLMLTKRTSGTTTGVRVNGYGKEFPIKVPVQEFENLHISPEVNNGKLCRKAYIPITSPSPKLHLSPDQLPTPRPRVNPAN